MKNYFVLMLLDIGLTTSAQDPAQASFASYSKFDFVPGDKLIFFDDFSLYNVGDFPGKWNNYLFANNHGQLCIPSIGSQAGKTLQQCNVSFNDNRSPFIICSDPVRK